MSEGSRTNAEVGRSGFGAARPSQRDLVVRSQHGDRDAYSQLTYGLTAKLFRIASLILRNEDHAADAIQDALLRAWIDIGDLRDPERFEAWLYRVLVRTCYALARSQRRRTVAEISVAWAASGAAPDAQQTLAVRDQLDRGFQKLSVEHRTVIVLVHYLGLPMKDAAAVIGVPLGTVQSRLSRALSSMRSALDADDRAVSPSQVGAR